MGDRFRIATSAGPNNWFCTSLYDTHTGEKIAQFMKRSEAQAECDRLNEEESGDE